MGLTLRCHGQVGGGRWWGGGGSIHIDPSIFCGTAGVDIEFAAHLVEVRQAKGEGGGFGLDLRRTKMQTWFLPLDLLCAHDDPSSRMRLLFVSHHKPSGVSGVSTLRHRSPSPVPICARISRCVAPTSTRHLGFKSTPHALLQCYAVQGNKTTKGQGNKVTV